MAERIPSDAPNSAPLLVVGSVAFDNAITPYGQKEHILGGAASYCSFAASYYAQVRMVGVIGNDFGEEHLERPAPRGIDLEGVQRDDSGPTFSGKESTTRTSTGGTLWTSNSTYSRTSGPTSPSPTLTPNTCCSGISIPPCKCTCSTN